MCQSEVGEVGVTSAHVPRCGHGQGAGFRRAARPVVPDGRIRIRVGAGLMCRCRVLSVPLVSQRLLPRALWDQTPQAVLSHSADLNIR